MMTNTQSSTSYYADGQYCLPTGGSNNASSAEEWLNLSLGGHHDDTNNYGNHLAHGQGLHVPSVNIPSKFFKCKYCTRKFLNSRALGGHQNAHKKERGEVRRFHMERSITMGIPNQQKSSTAVLQSIRVEPHALLHSRPVDEVKDSAGVHGYEHRTNPTWTPPQVYVEEETGRLSSWPGSFRWDSSSCSSSYDAYKMQGHDQSRLAASEEVWSINQQPWQDSQQDGQLADVSLDLSL